MSVILTAHTEEVSSDNKGGIANSIANREFDQ